MTPSSRRTQPTTAVRTRRAYFDCRYGQLHVRTAFPTTGGFDEQVTLFCVHSDGGSGRLFDRFLPLIADRRSAYAPDLPGCGESDPAPSADVADAALSVADLAKDLRLRQIDVLGFRRGSAVAIELAIAYPELVRRLVLVRAIEWERLMLVSQPTLVLATEGTLPEAARRAENGSPQAQFAGAADYRDDLFDAVPETLMAQIGGFLNQQAPPGAHAR